MGDSGVWTHFYKNDLAFSRRQLPSRDLIAAAKLKTFDLCLALCGAKRVGGSVPMVNGETGSLHFYAVLIENRSSTDKSWDESEVDLCEFFYHNAARFCWPSVERIKIWTTCQMCGKSGMAILKRPIMAQNYRQYFSDSMNSQNLISLCQEECALKFAEVDFVARLRLSNMCGCPPFLTDNDIITYPTISDDFNDDISAVIIKDSFDLNIYFGFIVRLCAKYGIRFSKKNSDSEFFNKFFKKIVQNTSGKAVSEINERHSAAVFKRFENNPKDFVDFCMRNFRYMKKHLVASV